MIEGSLSRQSTQTFEVTSFFHRAKASSGPNVQQLREVTEVRVRPLATFRRC